MESTLYILASTVSSLVVGFYSNVVLSEKIQQNPADQISIILNFFKNEKICVLVFLFFFFFSNQLINSKNKKIKKVYLNMLHCILFVLSKTLIYVFFKKLREIEQQVGLYNLILLLFVFEKNQFFFVFQLSS